jgi:N-acetylglutamate synthase
MKHPIPPEHEPLSALDIENLERATLDAVAPQSVQEIGRWLLPFDDSNIGRAISAVPLSHTVPRELSAAEQVDQIQAQYSLRGKRCAFRLADAPGLAAIHARLALLGYTAQQPTLVQTASARQIRTLVAPGGALAARLSATPSAEWASVYLAQGFNPVDGAQRVQALSRSAHVVYAIVQHHGHTVGAGTASFSRGWASLHGMRTLQSARGQGVASQVLTLLAEEALVRGYSQVFLQVEESNTSARALYMRAGFITAWRYHYWRLP